MPGDANLDGKVDINDLTVVLTTTARLAKLGPGRLQRRRNGGHQRSDHHPGGLRHVASVLRRAGPCGRAGAVGCQLLAALLPAVAWAFGRYRAARTSQRLIEKT